MEKLKRLFISPKTSIKQSLKRMDDVAEKILFVVGRNNAILGVVSDGDIRRWILKGRSLAGEIRLAMNKTPVVLYKSYTIEEAKKIMVSRKIECIPIVNEKREIVSAIWWTDLFDIKPPERVKIDLPVVIMAGGEGTRLAPFTKILPKPLIPIGEKPIVEHIIDKFVECGCKKFYLSVNYKMNIIKAYFSDLKKNYEIHYIEEKKPLGTAGSIYLLKNKIKTTFCVSNCDILINADYGDILKFHRENGNKITLVASMKHYTIPYGVCVLGKNGRLSSIKEKPEYDFLVNTGLYILEPEVLADIPENRFFHITELINLYMSRRKKIGVYPVSEKSWIDIGQWEELQETVKKFGIN